MAVASRGAPATCGWTLVNGDACAMAAGDLVLTPAWNWHEHHNPNDEPMMWFDGLDLPMVEYFDAAFFEDGDDRPAANKPVPDTSVSEQIYGHAGLRADGVDHSGDHSPLLAYRRTDTDQALSSLMATQPESVSRP
jgi:gentisate 1,2-dioxygenase